MSIGITIVLAVFAPRMRPGYSINIEKIGCELTDAELREIDRMTLFELEFYKKIFDFEDIDVKIKLFGNFSAYKTYQGEISDSATSDHGFYSSKLKTAIVYKNEKFLSIVNHEVSHLMLRHIINPVPKWINEGLADCFQGFYCSGNEIAEGIQDHKISQVKHWIKKGHKINLSEFLTYSNSTWRNKNDDNCYSSALSYCLVYYLYREHPDILKTILSEIKNNKHSVEIIEAVYPRGITGLENDFKKYYDDQ